LPFGIKSHLMTKKKKKKKEILFVDILFNTYRLQRNTYLSVYSGIQPVAVIYFLITATVTGLIIATAIGVPAGYSLINKHY